MTDHDLIAAGIVLLGAGIGAIGVAVIIAATIELASMYRKGRRPRP